MKYYSDTSFLFSIYVKDVHSPIALGAMKGLGQAVLITPIVEIEVCNAIQLQVFRKYITARAAQAATKAFESDILTGILAPQLLSGAMFEIAKRLSLRHTPTLGTRGFDLIHVASALALEVDIFLSFDNNQRKLADAAGLALYPATV